MTMELGKLEEAALKRKERLKNLKRKFDGQTESEEAAEPKENSTGENSIQK